MKRGWIFLRLLAALLMAALGPAAASAKVPSAEAVAGFESYVSKLEARLGQQHRSAERFAELPEDTSRLRAGELVIDKLTPEGLEVPGAMPHHWRGTAYVPGGKAEDMERLLRDYPSYSRIYAPDVVSTRVVKHEGDHYQVTMRVKQKHVITVVMDTTYDVMFGRLDAGHEFSTSQSVRVDEIQDAGTDHEHALDATDQHGFLWRINTYWSWEERDGGLYMQIESVSLTRNIPKGLGWAVGPFVESVPRESLELTLRATRDALRK